ncbi:mechanosensitive ion channel domain-containing protein [Aeropyrum pernix]
MARMPLADYLEALLPSYESLIEISMRLGEALLVLIAGLAAVLFVRSLSRRLTAARILDETSVSPFYRLSRDLIVLITVMISFYIVTGSRFIIILIAVLLAAILLATWDLLMNMAAYYAIIITRIVSRDEYIIMPNGVRGWVRDIRPLFVIVETKYGVYHVPNSMMLRLGVLTKRERSYYRLTVRVWGLPSQQLIDNVRDALDNVVNTLLPEDERSAVMKRVIIDEISEDSATVRIIVGMPHTEPKPERLADFVERLSRRLQEHGINHSITLEEQEGYEQRWGATLG